MWGVSGSPEYQQRSTDGPVGVGANQLTFKLECPKEGRHLPLLSTL